MKLQEQTFTLIKEQLALKGIIAGQYEALKTVQSRCVKFPGCRIVLTFNPARIRSTAAHIDKESLLKRPCFLCAPNRLPEQKALNFQDKYSILINPYPIFQHHLTIPDQSHSLQVLTTERMEDMLRLAYELPAYTLFYNGPLSGASAPDHFHFQAGERRTMPMEEECKQNPELLYSSKQLQIKTLKSFLRYILIAESQQPEILVRYFQKVQQYMNEILPEEPEPRMNVHVFYESSRWWLCIFPRRELRPRQFFEEGEKKIVFSPGAVDMGGIFILPREEDYLKITPALIEDMFRQVTYQPEDFLLLTEKIKKIEL